jgi:hypothetical protein
MKDKATTNCCRCSSTKCFPRFDKPRSCREKSYYIASVIRIKGIKLPHRLGPRSWQRQRQLCRGDRPWLVGSFLNPESLDGCKYLIAWLHLGVVVDGGRSDGFDCRSSLLPRVWRRWTFHVPPRALQGWSYQVHRQSLVFLNTCATCCPCYCKNLCSSMF